MSTKILHKLDALVRRAVRACDPSEERRKPGDPPSGGAGYDVDIRELAKTPLPPAPRAPSRFQFAKVILTALAVSTAAGCIGGLPAIVSTVLLDISEASNVLSTIQAAEEIWFRFKPSPDLQTKVERAIADANLALATAAKSTQGVKDLTADQRDFAFADFRASYDALQALLRDVGIVHGDRMSIRRDGQPAELVLPPLHAMRVGA